MNSHEGLKKSELIAGYLYVEGPDTRSEFSASLLQHDSSHLLPTDTIVDGQRSHMYIR